MSRQGLDGEKEQRDDGLPKVSRLIEDCPFYSQFPVLSRELLVHYDII